MYKSHGTWILKGIAYILNIRLDNLEFGDWNRFFIIMTTTGEKDTYSI